MKELLKCLRMMYVCMYHYNQSSHSRNISLQSGYSEKSPKIRLFLKVGDYSLKIHKSAYHLFSVFISKRGFPSLQTRKSFGEILSGNHRLLRSGLKLAIAQT